MGGKYARERCAVISKKLISLSAESVRAWVQIADLPEPSVEQTERIMIGAEAAIHALKDVATESRFDQEPGGYLNELDRLA